MMHEIATTHPLVYILKITIFTWIQTVAYHFFFVVDSIYCKKKIQPLSGYPGCRRQWTEKNKLVVLTTRVVALVTIMLKRELVMRGLFW